MKKEFPTPECIYIFDQDHSPSRSSNVRMNAVISETIKAEIGLDMQIIEIPAQVFFRTNLKKKCLLKCNSLINTYRLSRKSLPRPAIQ